MSSSPTRSDHSPRSTSSSSVHTINSSCTVQWGQQPFEQFQHRVFDLCKEIGLGSPIELTRLPGGSFNRVIGLRFESGPAAVVRILRRVDDEIDDDEPESMQCIHDQAVLLRIIAKQNPLLAPSVIAYDSTRNNAIGTQYLLLNRIDGVPLREVWENLALPGRKEIVDQLVEVLVLLDNIRFEKAGYIVATDNPNVDYGTPDWENAVTIKAIGSTYRAITAEPGVSLKDLLSKQLNHHDSICKRYEPGGPDFWCDLLSIFNEMEQLGWLEGTGPNVLYHWDLEPRNIMVAQDSDGHWKITGILDWDDVLAVPWELARKPPLWIWQWGDDPSWMFYADYDSLPEIVPTGDDLLLKNYFDAAIEKALPGYTEDMYGHARWIRRLWIYAWHGISSTMGLDASRKFITEWKQRLVVNGEESAEVPVSGLTDVIEGIKKPELGVKEAVEDFKEPELGVKEAIEGIRGAVVGINRATNGIKEATTGIKEALEKVQRAVQILEKVAIT